MSDHRGAIVDYTKAIEINPNFAVAYFRRGCSQNLLGDKESSIQDLKTSAALGYSQASEMIKSIL
jgi:hypothetical protein